MLLIAVMIQTPRVRAARRLRNANDERFSCRICYGDGQYSVSEECDHFYCGDCIRYALEAILKSGQFPPTCPQCRADGDGTNEHAASLRGAITPAALSYLQARGRE